MQQTNSAPLHAHHHPHPTILLMGPPNVGKSVLFNRFTGMEVCCANYSGTTIEYSAGLFRGLDQQAVLIDVPGTYTLEASNEAEQVAVDMLTGQNAGRKRVNSHCLEDCSLNLDQIAKPGLVLCVLDAVNLESSLFLLLHILTYQVPTIAVLNRVDLAEKKGITIDVKLLEKFLNIPAVPTVATTGQGVDILLTKLNAMLAVSNKALYCGACKNCGSLAGTSCFDDKTKVSWQKAETITLEVQKRGDNKKKFRPAKAPQDGGYFNKRKGRKYPKEGLGRIEKDWKDWLITPWPGLPLALLILAAAFGLVVGLGMGIRQTLLLPLFRGYGAPFIIAQVSNWVPQGVLQNILIGEYGFLIKGIEWPFTLVLPYVISFYFAMAILEDSGYLPRLGVLLDGLFNRIGIPGSSIIPLLLGYGCAIPAIMATRTLGSKKERLITASLICLTIPCVSQSGAFITLLAEQSVLVVVAIFMVSIAAAVVTGKILAGVLKGPLPMTIMELPELLLPRPEVVGKKIWVRIKRFMADGAFPMIIAVAVAAVLYETGLMAIAGRFLRPLVTGWLRLPEEAAVPLILGIMRRELTILPLLDMNLTTLQLFVGALVGLFYVPCIAVVASLVREFKVKVAGLILFGTSAAAFFLGGIAAQAGRLFF